MAKQLKNNIISIIYVEFLVGCAGLLCLFLSFCASPSQVLEPIEPSTNPEASDSGNYQKLAALLRELGYEPVGLEHEASASLELLLQVFSDESVKNRKIHAIYTGIYMGYEPKHETLTIGGSSDPGKIKEYIQKNIPLR